ncbi:hypothetical protein EKO27_g9392 [Xylaria grammica]|uniref:Uncharacterized protein n=1 Tax=Xylaria grammica TaxID=363999 RepID=A0A439CU61_9PEZI|nr:hypothetical protein EKO27_g9392 [Xylaria grammica]
MDNPERSQFLISRSRAPTDEAARFVETRLVVSGQSDAIYSERGGNFVTVQEGRREEQISAEMWKQADEEKEELFDLIEQLQNKFEGKGSSSHSGLELRRCKWDQVMVQVQETSNRWKTSPQRTSRAMKCIDRLGQNSEAFKSWLELLPAGDYGASISGVFTIVIGAAGRYTKVEDEIFQALAEIPEILERSRRYIKIYADLRDHFLEKRTFDLFRSKFSESILKQGSYKEELTKTLREVTANSERIQEEANQCLAWRLYKQESMLRESDQKTDQALHLLQSIYRLLRISPILGAGDKVSHQAVAAIADLPSGQVLEPKDISTQIHTGQRQSRGGKKSPTRDRARKARKLLRLLNYDSNITTEDVNSCLILGGALSEDKKAKAAAMVKNAAFREFMAEYLASSSLLVNGRVDLSSTEGLSPLSLVAAKLVRISEEIDSPLGSPYVVKYFCNQHPPFLEQSAISPPMAMMASLVGQLLSRMIEEELDVDLSMLTGDTWQSIEDLNLKVLCDIFQELTYQLPPKSVLLCIIDELTRYEIAPLTKETCAIIKRLTRLARRHEQLVFKLLVTCQGRELDIFRYFASETVDLDAEVEPDDSSSWRISTIGT